MLLADVIAGTVMLALSFVISLDSRPIRRVFYALARRRRHRRTSAYARPGTLSGGTVGQKVSYRRKNPGFCQHASNPPERYTSTMKWLTQRHGSTERGSRLR